MNRGFLRTGAIAAAFAAGTVLPGLAQGVWLVRPLIAFMLGLVFLQTRLGRGDLHRSHLWLFAVNLAIGFGAWAVCLPLGQELALAVFFAGIAPTASAAPVLTRFLGGRVGYVLAAFLVSNLGMGLLLPWVIPWVLGADAGAGSGDLAWSLGGILFVPWAAAWVLRRAWPGAASLAGRLSWLSFCCWLAVLALTTAKAVAFLAEHPEIPRRLVLEIAAAAALVCLLSFWLGRKLGRPDHIREAGQALGQKNTMLTLYLALAYASPVVALGPTFYVLWHNSYNAWQLRRSRG